MAKLRHYKCLLPVTENLRQFLKHARAYLRKGRLTSCERFAFFQLLSWKEFSIMHGGEEAVRDKYFIWTDR